MLRKILFVDDDQILRCAVEKHLAAFSEHFTTVVASDGFEAVKKLKQMPFSLVVLDLVMPRMDGISLISHIHEKYADIPIVIMSGMPRKKMQQLAAASGVVAYLSKPFQAEELDATIMNSLRKEAEAGIMHDVSPAVFLQFMEMDGKTCTIRILDKASKQGGILYFIEGRLMDARIGELRGIDAALKVFTWDAATIFLCNECPPRNDIINSGLQAIIMKAAGLKDESEDSPFADDDDGEASQPSPDALENLDDLVLPEDISAPLLFKQPTAGLSAQEEERGEEQAGLSFDDMKRLLEKEAGIQCKHSDIQADESMNKVVLQLSELGASSQFGNFRVGYIVGGKDTDRILLPGQPATLINIQANGPRDKIIELLRLAGQRTE